MGVGAFGRIAAVLAATALLAGLAILVVRLRSRRVPGLLIGIHAAIGVSGVVGSPPIRCWAEPSARIELANPAAHRYLTLQIILR